MLKTVSNRSSVLICLADCPADNHARQLAQFLYETLPHFSKFKRHLKNLNNSIDRKSESVSYKNSAQSWYDKSETFTYEIISN